MHRSASSALLALALVFAAPSAHACLWDNDTLLMERSRFPDALELITGKFPRHSAEFYQWRIRDRLPRIDDTPASRRFLDDVAVAYDKTGQGDLAIAMMILKDQRAPGEYETYANLGTFLIHGGDFAGGLRFIEQALAINPDAHFGREKYQKLLAEYVLERRAAGAKGLPLREPLVGNTLFDGRVDVGVPPMPGGFAGFLKDRGVDGGPAAVKGILGMMRFGDHSSPVLLEALGDLLMAPHSKDAWKANALSNAIAHQSKDAKLLATRAYLKASYETDAEPAKAAYRRIALASLQSQSAGNVGAGQQQLTDVEAELKREIEAADSYVATVARDEKEWIARGLDAERMFGAKYLRPATNPAN